MDVAAALSWAIKSLFGRGSASSCLSLQAVPALFVFFIPACSDEALPRPVYLCRLCLHCLCFLF
ncbi:MAG: hypothetical protein LBD59_10155 [Prevotellaceae bacterium]|nr:hypothetical protein [Prevotellaceae bacterium]